MRPKLKILIINLLFIISLSNCSGQIPLEEPVILISEIENFRVDGNFEEWSERNKIPLFCNQTGVVPDSVDLTACFKLAYNSRGLVFYFNVVDDTVYNDTINPWNGDAIEIFLAPEKASLDLFQISISLLFNENGIPVIRIDDKRKIKSAEPEIRVSGFRQNASTEMEMLIGWPWAHEDCSVKRSVAMQVYVDDSDKKQDANKNRLTWFNNNYSSETSFSYFPVQCTIDTEYFPKSTSRIKITDDDSLSMKIFGMAEGDTLKLYHRFEEGSTILLEEIVNSKRVISLSLSEFEIDFLNDELFVFQNSECVSYHNLIIAPRDYVNIPEPKFAGEILRFMAYDKVAFPKANSTLFIGSSSIRMWSTLESDFPELSIIHRGFGGSNSADALHYINQIVLPYKAKNIVYYEGDNDIPEGIGTDSIIKNIKNFIEIVQKENPETKFYIISPKPAISRLKYKNQYNELHIAMKKMIEKMEGTIFVDVSSPMYLPNGRLDSSLFLEDNLHMNEKGYLLWTNVLRQEMGLSL